MISKPLFALLIVSCLSSCAATESGVPAQSAPPKADAAKSDADKAKSAEADARKKARDLEYAEMQIEIAKLGAENERTSAKQALEAAKRELAAAKAAQENFEKLVTPLESDERALALQRAQQNVTEAKQELEELEAMYGQEKFAETTKELVISRGRARLQMSQRDLELAQRRADQALGFEHDKRAKELAERVTKAQQGVNEAKAHVQKVDLETRLSVLKAEHALEDAQREAPPAPASAPKS